MTFNYSELIQHQGWVESIRIPGQIAFVILRLSVNREKPICQRIQYVTDNKSMIDTVQKLTRQSYVRLTGTLRNTKNLNSEPEYTVLRIEVLTQNLQKNPIHHGKKGVSVRAVSDQWTRLKSSESWNILMTRAFALTSIRRFLEKNNFIQCNFRRLLTGGVEGGAKLYKLQKLEAYLAQSPQFEKQLLCMTGLDRIYDIGPTFRADPSNTTRHLNEFTVVDVEFRTEKVATIINLLKRLLITVSKDLQKSGIKVRKIESKNFGIVTYKNAKKILGLPSNVELERADERTLLKLMDKEFLFIINFPDHLRPFYTQKNTGFDLICDRCELVSGSLRTSDYRTLTESITANGLKITDFTDFLQPFLVGVRSTGGFGLGFDRLIMVLLTLPNIELTLPYKISLRPDVE